MGNSVRLLLVIRNVMRGILTSIGRKKKIFALVSLSIFTIYFFLPAVLLSIITAPVSNAMVNPWLPNLPSYLLRGNQPLWMRLTFFYNLAWIWFFADRIGGYGATAWFFPVATKDMIGYVTAALIFGAYFSAWTYRKDLGMKLGCSPRSPAKGLHTGRQGVFGGFLSGLAIVAGPMSAGCVACGASALPVLGYVFVGTTASAAASDSFSMISSIGTPLTMLIMLLGLIYLGWNNSNLQRLDKTRS